MHGSSILVLVLKSALSTFVECLNVLGSILSIKALVLEHFLEAYFKALSTFWASFTAAFMCTCTSSFVDSVSLGKCLGRIDVD